MTLKVLNAFIRTLKIKRFSDHLGYNGIISTLGKKQLSTYDNYSSVKESNLDTLRKYNNNNNKIWYSNPTNLSLSTDDTKKEIENFNSFDLQTREALYQILDYMKNNYITKKQTDNILVNSQLESIYLLSIDLKEEDIWNSIEIIRKSKLWDYKATEQFIQSAILRTNKIANDLVYNKNLNSFSLDNSNDLTTLINAIYQSNYLFIPGVVNTWVGIVLKFNSLTLKDYGKLIYSTFNTLKEFERVYNHLKIKFNNGELKNTRLSLKTISIQDEIIQNQDFSEILKEYSSVSIILHSLTIYDNRNDKEINKIIQCLSTINLNQLNDIIQFRKELLNIKSVLINEKINLSKELYQDLSHSLASEYYPKQVIYKNNSNLKSIINESIYNIDQIIYNSMERFSYPSKKIIRYTWENLTSFNTIVFNDIYSDCRYKLTDISYKNSLHVLYNCVTNSPSDLALVWLCSISVRFLIIWQSKSKRQWYNNLLIAVISALTNYTDSVSMHYKELSITLETYILLGLLINKDTTIINLESSENFPVREVSSIRKKLYNGAKSVINIVRKLNESIEVQSVKHDDSINTVLISELVDEFYKLPFPGDIGEKFQNQSFYTMEKLTFLSNQCSDIYHLGTDYEVKKVNS